MGPAGRHRHERPGRRRRLPLRVGPPTRDHAAATQTTRMSTTGRDSDGVPPEGADPARPRGTTRASTSCRARHPCRRGVRTAPLHPRHPRLRRHNTHTRQRRAHQQDHRDHSPTPPSHHRHLRHERSLARTAAPGSRHSPARWSHAGGSCPPTCRGRTRAAIARGDARGTDLLADSRELLLSATPRFEGPPRPPQSVRAAATGCAALPCEGVPGMFARTLP